MFTEIINDMKTERLKNLSNKQDWHSLLNTHFQPRSQVYYNNDCFCLGFFMSEIFNQAVEQSLNKHYVYDNTQNLFMGDELWTQEESMTIIDTSIYDKLYTKEQENNPDFPFSTYYKDEYWPWIKMMCLQTEREIFMPLQCVITKNILWVQDLYFHSLADSDFQIADNAMDALIKSLLKIIEHDAIMGYWYTNAIPKKIIFDKRTKALEGFFQQTKPYPSIEPEFYYLKNAFGINVIVCVVRDSTSIDQPLIGVSAEFECLEAMYCSYLEVIKQYEQQKVEGQLEEVNIKSRDAIDQKFSNQDSVLAGLLPTFSFENRQHNLEYLLKQFKDQNLSCYTHDFTSKKAKELGLTMVKSYSPDLLYLSTLGAPPLAHPGFSRYGKLIEAAPHPYPSAKHPLIEYNANFR